MSDIALGIAASAASVDSVFGQVNQALKNKKYYAALRQLSGLSIQYSKDITFLTYLSETQKGLQDFTNLLKTHSEIVRQRGHAEDHLNLMRSYYKLNFRNEALDVGLNLQSQKLSVTQEMQVGELLIKIYLEENDFEGAQETILRLSKFKATDFMYWAQGVVLLNLDQKDKALECFRHAVELNPENDQAWVSLGMMHKDMGDDDLHVANIEKAIDVNPYNSSALKQLTNSMGRKQDKMEAVFDSVRYYLKEHCFDEDISLCHLQMLCQTKQWGLAEFEMEKLILDQPHSEMFKNIKKSMFELQTM
ncbi:MAG: tetratricopeptide repeat protein [Bdellovibrio sp.]|nr:tetratricopeptide repeat protein [Bdellovibrio sp.]